MVKILIEKVEILITTHADGKTSDEKLVITGEVLKKILQIDASPQKAVIKAIKRGIDVLDLSSFQVQNQRAPPGTFDTFSWKPL